MTINSQTTIGSLIKHNPEVINAIAELSPRFNKLRNPVLRKLMAARTTIAMAAKVGGCKVEDLVNRILPLGFEYIQSEDKIKKSVAANSAWTSNPNLTLDVRPILQNGNDPLREIMKVVAELENDQVLRLINSFEPVPLINLLERQGFEAVVIKNPKSVDTYFRKKKSARVIIESARNNLFERYFNEYRNSLIEIDVRNLEMPKPMMTILEEVEKLPSGRALWVHHRKVPVYLLPELKEKGFTCCIDESPGDVQLLIFHEQ